MKARSREILNQLLHFGGLLVLAIAIAELVALTKYPAWAQAGLIFTGTKILGDAAVVIFSRERKYLYFEDYLRELLIFMVVAFLGILGLVSIEHYLGGSVWVPLLAAALAFIWR